MSSDIWIHLSPHHHSQGKNISVTSKWFLVLLCNSSLYPAPPPHPQTTTDLLLATIDLSSFPRFYVSGIITHVLLFFGGGLVWLHSLRIMILQFTHVVVCINNASFLFLLLSSILWYVYASVCSPVFRFICVDGYLGCFHFTNKAAFNIHVCMTIHTLFSWVKSQEWNGCIMS